MTSELRRSASYNQRRLPAAQSVLCRRPPGSSSWADMDTNSTTVVSVLAAQMQFGLIDYFIFGALLGMSAMIGVYFGCCSEQNTVSEYLLGGKKMGILPVALSNVASHVSGITLLGVPAEVYLYGTQYYVIVVSMVVCSFLVIFCYVPVFYPLQLNSAFQYLEMRFNSKVRTLGSFIFAVSLIVYIPIVIYVPALAFNQVTGASVHVIAPVICLVCIFYTTLGGLKAVVWTDALQSIFIAVSITSILVLGTAEIGGFSEVFRIAKEGHRLELLNFDLDPFARNTFWTVIIGTQFFWLSNFAVHPGSVQKFICVPSLRGAKIVMIISCVCIVGVISITSYIGLLIFAKYHDCDPIATKMIRKSGQLLPYYVMDVARDIPGLTGLFLSGVVSAALSTMSASLNTVSGTLYEDFVAPIYKTQSDAKASMLMKLIVLLVGGCCVMLIFVVERLGDLMQMAMSLTSITHAPMIYIFSVGLFFPWINSQGAIWGAISSLASMGIVVGGSQLYILMGKLKFPGKITTVDQCPLDTVINNSTVAYLSSYVGPSSPVVADPSVPQLFQMSYMYYCTVGVLVGVAVGFMVSHVTGGQPLDSLDRRTITPCMRRFLPQEKQRPRPEELKLLNGKSKATIVSGVNKV